MEASSVMNQYPGRRQDSAPQLGVRLFCACETILRAGQPRFAEITDFLPTFDAHPRQALQ